MKTLYLKLSQDGVILDVTEYPVVGHLEVQLPDSPLPVDIIGGWYRWEVDNYREDLTLKLAPSKLETRISATEKAIIVLMDMGLI